MKLQGIGIGAVTEALIQGAFGVAEFTGTFGQVEGVAVPVERHEGVTEIAEQGITVHVSVDLHGIPANLLGRRGVDACAESRGQQLTAEADPEDRFALIEGRRNQPQLVREKRVAGRLVDAHGAAHDNEARGVEGRRHGITSIGT